jgi:hypothetical protein
MARHRMTALEHERHSQVRVRSLAVVAEDVVAARRDWEDASLAIELALGTPLEDACRRTSIDEFVRATSDGPSNADGPLAVSGRTIRAPASTSSASTHRLLTSRQAALRLGYARPDGSPRDSFYQHVAPLLGERRRTGATWRFPVDRIEAFERGEVYGEAA